MNEIIQIEKIHKSFKSQQVLTDVSLSCKKGHIYGITGYNGSGKTVLFKCLCGFIKPDSGRILVRGKELHKDFFYRRFQRYQESGNAVSDPQQKESYKAGSSHAASWSEPRFKKTC